MVWGMVTSKKKVKMYCQAKWKKIKLSKTAELSFSFYEWI